MNSKNEITFHSLAPGKYNLKIIGSNSDGLWNEKGIVLDLTIIPAFWQTWWFKAIILLILIMFVYHLYKIRINKIKKQLKKDIVLDMFFKNYHISEKEKTVTLFIHEGKSNKEIEDKMFISYGTVKNHVYSIYKKLNIKRRAQLITMINDIKNRE